jgi:hypothetical protein
MGFWSMRKAESNKYNNETSDLEAQNNIKDSLAWLQREILTQARKQEIMDNLIWAEQMPDPFVIRDGYSIEWVWLASTPDNPLSPSETKAAIINMKDGYFIQDPRMAA